MIKQAHIKPSYANAKKRSKEEVKVLTDAYIMNNELSKIGINKKYHIITYGCQANERDSETISAILEDMSFTKTDNMEDADLILLNTCAIRENAHNKVFGMLGRIKHLKESKPNIITCLCGCMAQEEAVVNEIEEKYKWMDVVFGTHNIHNLPKLISEAIDGNELVIEVFSKEGDVVENLPVRRDNKYKAYVNIMYGCDKFCTYCIVPYTRGKQRSRKVEDILCEVNKLVKDGYKEVTLLGQNVNAYGKDLKDGVTFDKLLEEVAKTNIERVRFVTSHPWDFTDEMIRIIRDYKNVMPYVHLPVQSGSDKILKLMGRRYTKESYLDLALKIREMIPNVSLTTDIIVGFPGETEEDFNETLDVVEKCKYDSAFTFIYSKRTGTPAAGMENGSTKEEIQDRYNRLLRRVQEISDVKTIAIKGQTQPVLVEGFDEKGDGLLTGRLSNNILVHFPGCAEMVGKILNVKLVECKGFYYMGELAE